MQPTPPSSLSSDPSAQPGYAPIAWTAVAALAVAIGFAVILLYLTVASYFKGLPLTDSWIPFVPALVVVLAFVARRQIRASEGTRTGEVYANAAWWIAVVTGVAFVAYLLAVNFTVQRDARNVFNGWAENLRDLDAFQPADPNLLEACWLTLPPGTRPASKKDAARIEAAFGDSLAAFRQVDLIRVCQRNRGSLTLTAQGLKDWTVRAGEITCVLTASLGCAEGEYGMELPMRASVDDKGVRRWQIQPAGQGGYVKSRTLTRYGWETTGLEADALIACRRLTAQLGQPNHAGAVYLGFVRQAVNPARSIETLSRYYSIAEMVGAVAGPVVMTAADPLPPNWQSDLVQNVFTKPDGKPLGRPEAERVLALWMSGQVAPAGAILKKNLDVNGVLAVSTDIVEFRMPVEMPAPGTGSTPAVYRGRLVFRLPPDAARAVIAARQAVGTGGERFSQPPDDLTLTARPWRLVRFETDFKAIQGEQPARSSLTPG